MKKSELARGPIGMIAFVLLALASLGWTASAVASTPPSIESESASSITQTDATLEAQIDPGGLNTTYRFRLEWGCGLSANEACPMFCTVPESVCEGHHVVPLPSGELSASSEAQTVSLNLNDAGVTLHPETKYRYSVEATNSAGPTVKGPGQTFTTLAESPPAASTPSIDSESVSGVTEHDATLEAQINPGGLETSYQFRLEYGCPVSGNYCPQFCQVPGQTCGGLVNVPLPSGELSASSEAQTVSLDLNAAGVTLHPGEKYRYSVEATNSAGPTVKGSDQTFTTLPLPPSIESESVSSVTPSDATLEAEIDPGNLTTGVYYQFQLVTDPSEYASEILCPPEPSSGPFQPCIGTHSAASLPIGFIPGGSEPRSVSLALSSAGVTLSPGTTYHFRVLAAKAIQSEDTIEWEAPTVSGPDQTFTTPSPLPSIDSESASGITEHDATLEAQIDPRGLETQYEFQVDTNSSYNYTQPACPFGPCDAINVGEALPPGLVEPKSGAIPAGNGDRSVSLDLASIGATLQPGTTYHYRLIASNGGPTVKGPDQTFTTPSEPPGPIPLGAQSPGGGVQPSSAIQSPPPASPPPHRKHHRRHKRGLHRNSLHRASHTG